MTDTKRSFVRLHIKDIIAEIDSSSALTAMATDITSMPSRVTHLLQFLRILLYDLFVVSIERVQSFLDSLLVVVHPAGSLRPPQQPLHQRIVRRVEEQDQIYGGDGLFEQDALLLLPGVTVYEEPPGGR